MLDSGQNHDEVVAGVRGRLKVLDVGVVGDLVELGGGGRVAGAVGSGLVELGLEGGGREDFFEFFFSG